MNNYVRELNLDYDPFAPGAPAKVFFEGGERRQLVEEAIQLLHEGSMLVAVTGPLGGGKSTLAREMRRCMGANAVCIAVPATLFMNQAQFLEAVGNQLPKHKHIGATPSVETGIERLKQFAAELDLEAQSLVLLVDDAHELSAEVLELVERLIGNSGRSFIRIVLFGERQLNNLLQNTLTEEFQTNLVHFELAAFTTQDTLDYLQSKMSAAGLKTPLPYSGRVVGEIHNGSNGMPAAINALAADFLLAGKVMKSENKDPDIEMVPEGKKFNFGAQDQTQFDLDMVDEELIEETLPRHSRHEDAGDTGRAELRPAWMMLVDTKRYQLAASTLAVVLLATLFFWDTGTTPESSDPSLEVATGSDNGNVNRIQLPPPVSATASIEVSTTDPAPPVVQTAVEPSGQIIAAATDTVASLPESRVSNVESVIATAPVKDTESSGGEAAIAATTETTSTPAAPVAAITATVATSNNTEATSSSVSKLSGFEQKLMNYSANSFTVQILGSHSEVNVQKFIAGKSLTDTHGYYETRHLNKPWFVVVAGNYNDRSAANAAIEKLPQSIRDSKPWIRSLAEIQRDISQHNEL